MSGVLAGTLSCLITGASNVWRRLSSQGLLVSNVGSLCFADHLGGRACIGEAGLCTAPAATFAGGARCCFAQAKDAEGALALVVAGDQLGFGSSISVFLALVAARWFARGCSIQDLLPSAKSPGAAPPLAHDCPSADCRRALWTHSHQDLLSISSPHAWLTACMPLATVKCTD